MATKQDLEHAARLGAVIARETDLSVGQVQMFVVELLHFGKQAQSIAVAQCNYMSTEEAEKKRKALEKRIDKCLERRGLFYSMDYDLTGDPRGWTMRILMSSHNGNWEEAEGVV